MREARNSTGIVAEYVDAMRVDGMGYTPSRPALTKAIMSGENPLLYGTIAQLVRVPR